MNPNNKIIIPFDQVVTLVYGPIYDILGDIDVELVSDSDFDYDIRFAYSIDGTNWSNWFDNKDDFFIQYKEMLFVKASTWVKVRVETANAKETEDLVNQITEETHFDTRIFCLVKINGREDIKPDKIEVYDPTTFVIKNPEGLWTPYKHMEKAFEIWKNSSERINDMFGHWVYYFKTEPNTNTKSVTFKQYTMHNVVDMKMIKVSVPGNNMPSGRNQYSEFGITLPDEFNISILTESFQKAFGYDAIPNENDYLYMPITGKMYSINAIYETKGFMQKSVMYDAILAIYSKAENVDDSNFDFSEFIDTIPEGATSQSELDDIDISAKDYMNVQLCDAYRKFIHKNLEFIYNPLEIQGVTLFQNMYNLASLNRNELAVQYNLKFVENKLAVTQNVSLSFWIYTNERVKSGQLFTITQKQQHPTDNNVLATVGFEPGGIITISCNNKILRTEIKLETNTFYAVAISVSGQYNVLMLTVQQYKNAAFNMIFDDYVEIGTITAPIDGLNLYASNVCISNIGLNDGCIETDEFINSLTLAFPEANNMIFDKAQKPLPQTTLKL